MAAGLALGHGRPAGEELDQIPDVAPGEVLDQVGRHRRDAPTALLDLGVPGLLMMLIAVAVSLLAVWRFQRAGHRGFVLHALEAACVATLVNCLFGDYLWTKSFWLAWTLLTWAMYSDNEPAGTSRILVRHE